MAKKEEQEKQEKKKSKDIKQISAIKKYCGHILDSFEAVIKSIWLLTSSEFSKTNDMTAVIIFDDMQTIDHLTRKKLDVCAHEASKKVKDEYKITIHASYYNLSEYWDLVRHGSPVTFQEIRDGIPVYDPSGFFVPLKKLLHQGKISGTKEAMRTLIGKAPLRIRRIKQEFMVKVLEHIYTAVVDAGQAPLIVAGFSPPPQKMVAKTLADAFVKKGKLEPEYVRYVDEIVKFWKDYEHNKIRAIHGDKLDRMLDNADRFIRRMEELMEDIEAEKIKMKKLQAT